MIFSQLYLILNKEQEKKYRETLIAALERERESDFNSLHFISSSPNVIIFNFFSLSNPIITYILLKIVEILIIIKRISVYCDYFIAFMT